MMEERKEVPNGHAFFQRRHFVTFLTFLCSLVIQAQRVNISFAIVDMVSSTSPDSVAVQTNVTECFVAAAGNSLSNFNSYEFSWDSELQGYILSAAFIGYLFTQIIGGILVGHFGSKPIIVTSLFFASLCNLLSPMSARQHPYLLIVITLMRGMAQGLTPGAYSLLMAQWFPKYERGFHAAFIYTGFPLGGFIGSLASGALCEIEFDGGWPLVFYVFGSFGFILGMIGMYLSGCDFTWSVILLVLHLAFIAGATPAFTFGGCLIVAADMTPTFCGVLTGVGSTIASLSGFIVPVLAGKLTKDNQTIAQWQKMFLINIFVSLFGGIIFLLLGTTDVQKYDPVCNSNGKKIEFRRYKEREKELTSHML